MYRRLPPPPNRRYASIPPQSALPAVQEPTPEDIRKNTFVLNQIPLPNEVETSKDKAPVRKGNPFSNILSRIHIDDLILLGLVILFIDEGPNEAEDDFLIVILLYLFLSGRR